MQISKQEIKKKSFFFTKKLRISKKSRTFARQICE